MKKAKRISRLKWPAACLIALGCFVFSLVISATNPLTDMDLRITDMMFSIRGPLDMSDSPIVLVAISDQADSELPGKWPWPTSYHARLVENLNRAGARVIAFDVIFNEMDSFNLQNDTLFAESMRRHGNVVLAGNLQSSRVGTGAQAVQMVLPNRLFVASNPNKWGFVSVNPDNDGFLRRYRVSQQHLGKMYYSFGLETIKTYIGADTLISKPDPSYFNLGFTKIPRYTPESMRINFYGPPKSYPEYSYEQIIDDTDFLTLSDSEFFGIESTDQKDYGTFDDPEFGLLHTDVFRDKIVLVGATMLELQDYYSTPFAPERGMPGYEAHANAIQTILTENYLYRISDAMRFLLVLLVTFLVVFTGIYLKALAGFLLSILYAILFVGLAFFMFIAMNVIIPVVAPLMGIASAFTSTVVYSYVIEQREKSRIRDIFGTYVSPELVSNMIESGEQPKLGGDEVYITAYFSDIQSFSSFSEQLNPTQLVELLNEYLSAMTEILKKQQGTLDKYIGDAIVAFFGAPVAVEDHALRACVTARMMLDKQLELREKWASQGDKWPAMVGSMQTRIGINTGSIVTGNMGSESRFNYTMMGDDVNLAARCESGAKAYGVYAMATAQTKTDAESYGDDCVFRHLDKIIVKGRTKPVDVYEIPGLRNSASEQLYECIGHYETGLEHYFGKRWDDAIRSFEHSAGLEMYQPDTQTGIVTNPSMVLLERCREMKKNPPSEDWNGVYVMKTK